MTEPHETIHKVPIPTHFFKYLVAEDGNFLGFDEDDGFSTYSETPDDVIWDQTQPNQLTHVKTGRTFDIATTNGDDSIRLADHDPNETFRLTHGPADLPSAYLETMRRQGWVCMTQVIDDQTLLELERTACTDRFEGQVPDPAIPALCQNPAVGRTVAEPLSLWVIRQYMQTNDIHLSHVPGFAVLGQDDGKRNVQGWHSDFPYHWGIPAKATVPTPSGKTVLGVQRNVCVSPFTRNGGATIFKLGSHAKETPPPADWGDVTTHLQPGYREKHGLPYGGPEADVIEAPGGSIILYDSRTWHRAGVNRTTKKRAALLQAVTPMYIFPKNDTSRVYKKLLDSRAYEVLNAREKQELQNLMVHRFIGPGGQYAITVDKELTEKVKAVAPTGY